MEKNELENNSSNNNKPKISGGNNNNLGTYWIYGLIGLLLIGLNVYMMQGLEKTSKNLNDLELMLQHDDVEKLIMAHNEGSLEIYLKPEKYKVYGITRSRIPNRADYKVRVPIETFNSFWHDFYEKNPTLKKVPLDYDPRTSFIPQLLNGLILFAIFGFLIMIVMRRVGGGGGAGAQIFNIGKSKAQMFDQNAKVNTTFADVAGLDEAKEEVMEVVDFLKNPKKYTTLGGKIPKGVLLVGPPGTGKTLLAKAVAGEANVPFFSISGSDFVEMFVGVGASRVRDLFRQARDKAPCIIFIDEIDAIGRSRGRGQFQGGNDERENTLNQLLVEMDGFPTDKAVILMAATNRADTLDNALMRPGRFDRQIGIDLPDLKGREQIFAVHLRNIKIIPEVNPLTLAEMTPGFAGADIANVCNEAALIAARRNKSSISMDDFNYALDKVIGGLERKSKIIAPEEKIIIAYHEAGHAICGWFLEHASPLVKVTIVPRGIGTLGYAQYLPKDEYITRTEALKDRICMTLGGRAAEEVVFGKISTGAQNDLDQITRIAYSMVAIYGMNDNVGNVSYYGLSQDGFNRPYSDTTATLMDNEVRHIIDVEYIRCKKLLTDKRHELELLAQHLLEREVLVKSDVEALIGPRPYAPASHVEEIEREVPVL